MEAGQMEGILQSMTEGVIAVGSQGQLLLVNPAARQIFGLPQGAIPTSFPMAIRHPGLQAFVQEVFESDEPKQRELTLYAPVERHLMVHASSSQGAAEGTCAVLVFHDITDLKRLEGIRRNFVANVSHELKTPLAAIQGAVETLLSGALEDPASNRAFVEAIAEESVRLRRLIEDLLTLAQVESRQELPQKELIPVASFLKKELARYEALAKSREVTLRLEEISEGFNLQADSSQLAQAIGNLLDNAIKYNRPGGRVTLRVASQENACRIEVEDTGIGIPPEDLPRIFERFYRVDKARSRETGGTGLGLAIVKHIAEAHGGSVCVESQTGRGCRFTLILPR